MVIATLHLRSAAVRLTAVSTAAGTAALSLVPSQEEAFLREAVAGICRGFGREYMERKRDAGEPPSELWEALASRGYLGVNIPEEYDGGGLGMAALSWVAEEISASGCALLLIVVSPAIVGNILAKHGTSAQKERWLRGIGSGATKIAFAITEADAGTHSHNLATSLRRDNGRFLLNGQKTFISGVEDADAVLVVARTRLADGKLGLPSLAIVDVDAAGFTRQQIEMAVRGADKQWTLFFDDVELEAERDGWGVSIYFRYGRAVSPIAGSDYPGSYGDLLSWFPDDEACRDYLDWLRWREGWRCPACGGDQGWLLRSGRRECAECARQTSVTAGTLFHHAHAADGVVRCGVADGEPEAGDLGAGAEADAGDWL